MRDKGFGYVNVAYIQMHRDSSNRKQQIKDKEWKDVLVLQFRAHTFSRRDFVYRMFVLSIIAGTKQLTVLLVLH
jgi:hypothetical protein